MANRGQHSAVALHSCDIAKVTGPRTKLVAPYDVAKELSGDVTAVAPGESHEVAGVRFTTVPAYNLVEERLEKHPRAKRWVGFVLELGSHSYYHAGDTDHGNRKATSRSKMMNRIETR